MSILAAEVAPLAKVGGLGDFAAALTRFLSQAGHDVRLFFPAYGDIDWGGHEVGEVDFLRQVPIRMGERELRFTGLFTHLAGTSIEAYAIDCPELYHRPGIYSDAADEPLRFAMLMRAAIESCQRMGWGPQIFHCNDWHTALVPLYLRSLYRWDSLFAASRTVLTIHNIGYQGVFGGGTLSDVGLVEAAAMFPKEDLEADRINFLKTGILHADMLTTVSPNHAAEIQGETYGMGLDGLLRHRSSRLKGILNGVDYGLWNPQRDGLIPYHYSENDLRGKAWNKRSLLSDASLPRIAATPLVGMVTRLARQKGIELLPEVLPRALSERRFQLIVLGSGEPEYERFLRTLQERFPQRVFFYRGYHDQLAHRIEAASDIFLMPSLYEPCGLNQLYSLRYGAVPLVRRTGGLADSVTPFDPASGSGTGFVFEEFTAGALRSALDLALDTYANRRLWRRLVRTCMAQDFSWERQVVEYENLYRQLAS